MAGLRGYLNNFSTALTNNITNSATSFDLNSVTGVSAQIIATNGYVAMTIDDGTNIEIIHVTGVSGSTITCTRGQEGTSGTAFLAGDTVEIRPTRDSFVMKPFGFGAIEASQSINSATLTKINFVSAAGGFDIGDSLDLVNDRLAPTIAGYYYVEIQISLNSMTDNKQFELHMKNQSGTYPYQAWSQGTGHTMTTFSHRVIHYFDGSTNWLEFYVRHNEGSALTIAQDASRLLFYRISEV